jgi:hypothetical protein
LEKEQGQKKSNRQEGKINNWNEKAKIEQSKEK